MRSPSTAPRRDEIGRRKADTRDKHLFYNDLFGRPRIIAAPGPFGVDRRRRLVPGMPPGDRAADLSSKNQAVAQFVSLALPDRSFAHCRWMPLLHCG